MVRDSYWFWSPIEPRVCSSPSADSMAVTNELMGLFTLSRLGGLVCLPQAMSFLLITYSHWFCVKVQLVRTWSSPSKPETESKW